MSNDYNPPQPTGNSNLAEFQRQVHRRNFSGEGQFRNSRDVKVDYRHNGVFLRVKPGQRGAPAPPVNVDYFVFKQSLGDYFLTTDGTAIAKIPEVRCSIISQTIYGTVYNYTYPHNPSAGGPSVDPLAYVYRKSRVGSGTPEVQLLVPPLVAGDIICAMEIPGDTDVMSDPKDYVTTPKNPDGSDGPPVPITWQHFATGVAWSKANNQSM